MAYTEYAPAVARPLSVTPLWQIDVRKSMARPPGELREELRRIAKVTRARAIESVQSAGGPSGASMPGSTTGESITRPSTNARVTRA